MREFISAALITFLSVTANALPLVWRADWPGSKPVETLVHRGTDIEFQPQWYINGEPANSTNWTFQTFVQTNAQATGEWFGPLPGAAFSHTNDIGAAFYNVMVRAQMPGGGVNYTAFARLRMLDSPGYTPGELPLPVQSIGYDALINKPQINGNTLTGDKTGAQLGVLDLSGGTVTGDINMPTGLLDAGDVRTRSMFDFVQPGQSLKYLDAPENSGKALTDADISDSSSAIADALGHAANHARTYLANQTFDFSGEQGVMAALKACVEALGGSVTNMPAAH